MSKIGFKNFSNRTYGDRFIPNRSNTNTEMAHFKLKSYNNQKVKNDIFSLKSKDKNKYRDLLQLTINYQESKIYSFSNKSNIQSKKRSPTKIFSQWPCLPRKYPIVSTPDIILDWPINNVGIKWNIVDWGSNGYMATIWGGEVFLWCKKDDRPEEITETKIKAYGALRWNNSGTLLAVAGRKKLLTLWAFPERKYLYSSRCPYDELENCEISCLAWDQTDTILVSGCSGGILCLWDLKGNSLDYTEAHWTRIVSMAFDSSNKYLCSSGTDGMVRIWNWPTLEPHVEIEYCNPIRAIAFHPWRPSLLAVGGGLGDGSLAIWNVCTCQRIGYHRPDRESMVDCLAWNRVTGELVSSYQVMERNRREDFDTLDSNAMEGAVTKVLVHAGLEKVVDSLDVEAECGRILYLMWDKTGTKLATACTNENLVIWNFLGVTKKGEAATNKNKILAPSKRSVLSNFEKYIR